MADQSPSDSQIAAQVTHLNAALDMIDAALTKPTLEPSPDDAAAALLEPVRALAAAAKE